MMSLGNVLKHTWMSCWLLKCAWNSWSDARTVVLHGTVYRTLLHTSFSWSCQVPIGGQTKQTSTGRTNTHWGEQKRAKHINSITHQWLWCGLWHFAFQLWKLRIECCCQSAGALLIAQRSWQSNCSFPQKWLLSTVDLIILIEIYILLTKQWAQQLLFVLFYERLQGQEQSRQPPENWVDHQFTNLIAVRNDGLRANNPCNNNSL